MEMMTATDSKQMAGKVFSCENAVFVNLSGNKWRIHRKELEI